MNEELDKSRPVTEPARCPDCHSAWAGNPAITYHELGCARAGGEAQADTPSPVTTAARPVKISIGDVDGHVNCAQCDYSTAGSHIRGAAVNHTKQTGHTTVISLRAVERIQPA